MKIYSPSIVTVLSADGNINLGSVNTPFNNVFISWGIKCS